jgi:PKD repeat protein
MIRKYLIILAAMLSALYVSAQADKKVVGKAPRGAAFSEKHDHHPRSGRILNFTDGFESYTDFNIQFSPWTLSDADSSQTWGIEGVSFLNQYAPMAFIVFNPSATTPAMTSPGIQPHSGNKLAACFAAKTPPNNDWLISPQLIAGANTSVSFWVKSYSSQYGLERFKVGVSTTNTLPGSFTIISGTNYLTAPADAWQQKTFNLDAYNGQTIYIGIQCVSDDAFVFMVDDFEFNTTLSQNNSISGQVTDATNGNPIPGAQVSIAGLTTITDNDGNYILNNIPEGTLIANFSANQTAGTAPLSVVFSDQSSENANTVSCSKTGYITYTNNQVIIPNGGTLNLNISLSPVLSAGNMRFVLNWGASPVDLDSHLNTPLIEGQAYHVYYDNEGSATIAPYALLDYDITTGFGPETMTIYQMYPGIYQYYVYNYSETPDIKTSQAVVQIYDQSGLLHTLQIPSTGSGLYWYVCDINGSNGQVTIRNVVQESAPGNIKFKMSEKEPKPASDKNIVSWHWNFGDGSTSAEQNPTHIFNSSGSYTISLTVNNGTSESYETKTDYIQVGPQAIAENELSSQIDVYPVPAESNLQIKSPKKIKLLRITDLAGIELFRIQVNDINFLLNVGNLNGGIYFLLIETTEGMAVKKFTIK